MYYFIEKVTLKIKPLSDSFWNIYKEGAASELHNIAILI